MLKIKKKKHKGGKNIRELMRLCLAYFEKDNFQQAANICEEVLREQPQNITFLLFLGEIYYKSGDYNGALKNIRKALQINPTNVDAYNNLGVILKEKGQLDEAISCYQKLIQLDPKYSDAYSNLGTIFRAKGKINEAEMYYKHALQTARYDFVTYSNLLLTMNYNSRHDARTIYLEHLNFAQLVTESLSPAICSYKKKCVSDRRIKIGYVSPDFRRHSVNYFLEPVLASHNHDRFAIFCYSDVVMPDSVTERLQCYADQWRNIKGRSDEQVSEMIRIDDIDILIDLAGHTGYNRMLLFARKPAPIQVSWLGYPNTTGLSTIDYRLVDAHTDPPGLTDPYYTEKLIRMPECFLCYSPDKNSPLVGNLPVLKSGYITFGSCNVFSKISPEIIGSWAEILKAVPESRIMLKTKSFSDASTREYAMHLFIQRGIRPERIDLLSYAPSYSEHLDIYNRLDIAFDTFPYNGTTTTCEALWMGVPVIALAGNTHVCRVSASLLSNVGLGELIARTPREYVELAINLATDINRLRSLRDHLRQMMANSPLTNVVQFTHNLEDCYRMIWERWCKSI